MIYKVGDKIKLYDKALEQMEGSIYIIALPEPFKACLISIEDGVGWGEPVSIKDHSHITEEEMKSLLGPPYVYYEIIKV